MTSDKGRQAEAPGEIPGEGWLDVGKRVKEQITLDHIDITAAGVAFYFFLALFPSIVAVIAIYGLLTDPQQVEQQMSGLTAALPAETHQLLSERLKSVTQTSSEALGWSAVLSILLSLWSANKGTKALFEGVNIAYNQENKRSFLRENALTLLFTICGMVLGIVCISLVVGFPALEGNMGLPEIARIAIKWGRWVLLIIILILALAVIYKFAPYRSNPKFKWVSWGSAIAAVLWMAGSWAFSYYVNNFGNYNEAYGSVAAVIILMLWFNLTSFIILLGAEINSELEFQTARDTTTGEERPMGERGAYHADHVVDEE